MDVTNNLGNIPDGLRETLPNVSDVVPIVVGFIICWVVLLCWIKSYSSTAFCWSWSRRFVHPSLARLTKRRSDAENLTFLVALVNKALNLFDVLVVLSKWALMSCLHIIFKYLFTLLFLLSFWCNLVVWDWASPRFAINRIFLLRMIIVPVSTLTVNSFAFAVRPLVQSETTTFPNQFHCLFLVVHLIVNESGPLHSIALAISTVVIPPFLFHAMT